jgi:aspartyl-tRNA(Asn)/glutamyl-tRNA(Gln) amidotransferase subunit B
MPGVLPSPNIVALEYAVKMGLATNCRIIRQAMWTRKNYFYTDLPKGYQVTQQGGSPIYDHPICTNGYIELESDTGDMKRIGITRIHLEEDAGKLIHDITEEDSLFDANRCGTPLLEIVSEPDMRSPTEAYLCLEKLKQTLEYLDICDANMERGNLRCDANVSLRREESSPLGARVEIKNMNSFHNLERALQSEVELQALMLDRGEQVKQLTKRWDPATGKTVLMRTKEEAQDYRYFPEPDLLRLHAVDQVFIDKIKAGLPELPNVKLKRFVEEYGLSSYDAGVLTHDKHIAEYFEKVCRTTGNFKAAANWVMGAILKLVKETEEEIKGIPVEPERLGGLIKLIDEGEISGRIAKQVFKEMLVSSESPEMIVEKKGLKVMADKSVLNNIIEDVLKKNPDQVRAFKGGKEKVFGFFMGQIMQASKGKASPEIVNQLLRAKLSG